MNGENPHYPFSSKVEKLLAEAIDDEFNSSSDSHLSDGSSIELFNIESSAVSEVPPTSSESKPADSTHPGLESPLALQGSSLASASSSFSVAEMLSTLSSSDVQNPTLSPSSQGTTSVSHGALTSSPVKKSVSFAESEDESLSEVRSSSEELAFSLLSEASVEKMNSLIEKYELESDSPFPLEEVQEAILKAGFLTSPTICLSYFELAMECKVTKDFQFGKLLRLPLPAPQTSSHLELIAKFKIMRNLLKEGTSENDSRLLADTSAGFQYAYLRKDISGDVENIHVIFSLIYFLCEDALYKNLTKLGRDPKQARIIFEYFFEAIQGKPLDKSAFTCDNYFDDFSTVYSLLRQLSDDLMKIPKLNMSDFIYGFKLATSGWFNHFFFQNLDKPITSTEYLKYSKLTAGVEPYSSLYYASKKLHSSSFMEIKEYQEFEDLTKKICRLNLDIACFFIHRIEDIRDNNFVLIKQKEGSLTLTQAFSYTVSLHNRLVLQMITLQCKIQENGKLTVDAPHLLPAITILMKYAQGCMEFCYTAEKYTTKIDITASRKALEFEDIEVLRPFVSYTGTVNSFQKTFTSDNS